MISKLIDELNYWALGLNAAFILLLVVQTHLWYDGLAQDVSIFSSQGSVIVLLVWVLLLQGSLFFTRIHVNKYWTFVQEFTVLVHGAIVAVFQGNGMWPMFAFGFGAIFILTQLYGLGLKAWQRWVFIGIYVLSALYVYNGRLVEGLLEIIRIPAIDYILVFVLAGIFWLIIKGMAF